MGVVIESPGKLRGRVAASIWCPGDTALCGTNRVRIAAQNGGRVLVVGEALSDPWSIWMKVSKLRPTI